jgi:hypothetical protein
MTFPAITPAYRLFFALVLTVVVVASGQDVDLDVRQGLRDDPASKAIRKVVDDNCTASRNEDLTAALRTIHPKSPGYAYTEQTSRALFDKYDLDYKVVRFTFIGRDDPYAVARVILRTANRGTASKFANNTTDSMMTFRLDGPVWKLWTQSTLEVDEAP